MHFYWGYFFISQVIFMSDTKTMQVIRISYQDTKQLILNVHYARRMPSVSFAYGLFDNDELEGIVTYGQPASPSLCKGVAGEEHRKDVIELNRLVIKPDYENKNAASFLVGHSLKMLPKGMFVVSYADVGGWGHVGYIYQATNFLFTGTTKPRTDIYSESGHSRHHCGDRTKRQPRSAKNRYIYITGGVSVKKRLLQELKYPVLKYPKGDSRRYDVNNPIGLLNMNSIPGDK